MDDAQFEPETQSREACDSDVNTQRDGSSTVKQVREVADRGREAGAEEELTGGVEMGGRRKTFYFIYFGGDFNCTVDSKIDRNHAEPHAVSCSCLRHELCDVWRGFHNAQRQYTWTHVREVSVYGQA